MILVEIPCVGPYKITENSVSFDSGMPNDALCDHDPYTDIVVDGYLPPSNSLLNNLRGQLQKGGEGIASRPMLNVYARVEWTPTVPGVVGVRLITAGAGNSSSWTGEFIDTPSGRLFKMDSGALQCVNNAIAGYNVTMQMSVEAVREGHSGCRIQEAWIVVELRNADAPPCRMIGRGDSLGVGSGRMFPPSKMQQSSNRGVGAY